MHPPPHATCPDGQAHVEPVHEAPVPTVLQLIPALPTPPVPQPAVAAQWSSSVTGSMQTPLQLTCPVGQETAQPPLTQTWPVVLQSVPAEPPPIPQPTVAPQCKRSVAGTMHAPLQLTCPTAQEVEHAPALHTSPDAQIAPSLMPMQSPLAPQKSRLLAGWMQVPPQLICVPPQDTWQSPAEQTWPAGQMFPSLAPVQSPEAPQKVRLVSGSTQLPAHSTRLVGQESWQVPSEQTSPEVQAAPSLAPVQSPEAPQ
jgi:hypothetical protein